MSFRDMKLTNGEKRLITSIFRLRLLMDRIPEPEDGHVKMLITLSRRDVNAISYALTMLEQIQRAAEDVEKNGPPAFIGEERKN